MLAAAADPSDEVGRLSASTSRDSRSLPPLRWPELSGRLIQDRERSPLQFFPLPLLEPALSDFVRQGRTPPGWENRVRARMRHDVARRAGCAQRVQEPTAHITFFGSNPSGKRLILADFFDAGLATAARHVRNPVARPHRHFLRDFTGLSSAGGSSSNANGVRPRSCCFHSSSFSNRRVPTRNPGTLEVRKPQGAPECCTFRSAFVTTEFAPRQVRLM